MNIRRFSLFLHTVCGIGVGAILLVTGLTGGLLTFRDEADATLNPSLMKVEPKGEKVPIQTVLDNARAAHPGATLRLMRLPEAPNGAILVQVRPPKSSPVEAYFNPYDGKEIGTRKREESVMVWVFDIHSKLLLGEAGKIVLGVFGLGLLILCLSGLHLWLPTGKTGSFLRSFSIGSGKRMMYDVHRLAGILAVSALTLTATTGVIMALEDWTQPLFGITRGTPPPAPKSAPTPNPVPLDKLVATAEASIPGSKATIVNLPGKPTEPVQVRLHGPGEWHPVGRSAVFLDGFSGEVLSVRNARDASAGVRLYNTFYPLHTGKAGGLIGKLFQLLTGVAPAILFITGFVMWRRKLGKKS
jgi:uncharacterized iron-regulated membrane protein